MGSANTHLTSGNHEVLKKMLPVSRSPMPGARDNTADVRKIRVADTAGL